jgi:Ca2+-binding EF-hand superfamily protein
MAEPDWLRLQKKVFTRYVQQKLRQGGIKTEVKNLIEDLKCTNLLIDFAEVLSQKTFPGKKPVPQTAKIQQMNNANIALKFVKESCGVSTQTSAENIVDGNEKLILGMIFQIILKFFKIEDDEGNASGDVKEALMLWLKNRTAGYSGVELKDWTKSFHNGLPFCALIHKMRPKLLNYDSLTPAAKLDNITLALNLGEKYINVPKYIEPSDIEKMDDVGMIVYLSDWYYGVALLQKQDVAARRVGKLIVMTELHDNLKAQYKADATKLRGWVDGKIKELNERKFDNTLAGIQSRLNTFREYKKTEKGQKLGDLLDLESLFNNIAVRLANNNRPAFNPGDTITPQALQGQFGVLEKAELETAAAYAAELARQLRLHKLADRFKASAAKLVAYVAEKDTYFCAAENIDSVEKAEDALDQQAIEATETENARTSRTKDLQTIVAELEKEQFEKLGEIKSTMADVNSKFDKCLANAGSKNTKLQGELKKQQDINDGLCKDLANAVNDFNSWLNGKKERLSEKTAPLEDQLKVVATQEADSADAKLAAIKAAEDKVVARQIINNPHTNVSHSDCVAAWGQFGLTLKKKRELLESQIEEKKKAGLTAEQLQEIDQNFKYFDKDKSGLIDKRELRACLQSLGEDATPKDVQAVLDVYDSNKDGKITFDEFSNFMKVKLGDKNSKEEIQDSFKYLTFEKDYVTVDQMSIMVNDISWKTRHVDYLKKEMKPKGEGLDWSTWTDEVFAR